MRRRTSVFLVLALMVSLLPSLAVAAAADDGPDVVISQVYGGGGNSGALYRNDFVELFNRGDQAQDITGWSIQYTSANGNSWGNNATTLPSATLAPGQRYLVQLAAGGNADAAPLPTPDHTAGINMSATSGKVALASSAAALPGETCPTGDTVVDAVGFGTQNCAAIQATTALANNSSALRDEDRCADTYAIVSPPEPENSTAPLAPCGGPPPPAPVTTSCQDLTTVVGEGGSATQTASDADGTVTSVAITDGDTDGISLEDVTPATEVGGTLTAELVAADTLERGVYDLELTFTNDDAEPQSATCDVTVTVHEGDPGDPVGVGDLVISEVYGGGGNSGAPLSHDYVELFNRGEATVTFTDWSVQYSSAAGSNWQVTTVSGSLEPGQYYLVQMASGANTSLPGLPTPDATGSSNMAAGSGKVALVATTTALSCSVDCLPNAEVSDFVGYGLSASAWEGSGPTDQLSNSTSASRLDGGCVDTDDNRTDFTVGDPEPRNSEVTRDPCPDTPPAVTLTAPVDGDIRIDPATDVVITFSEPVTVSGDWYAFACDEQDITVTQAGGPRTYTLAPGTDLPGGTDCTVTVFADQVVDRDHDPLTMTEDHTFSFSVDDGSQIRIAEIQGAGHITPLLGREVTTVPGIVTARVGNGFYLQDPAPDHDDRNRSDGIFVFTGSGNFSGVAAGDAVTVTGTASEFRAGGATSANLSVTQIAASDVQVASTGNVLPDPVIIGEDGRQPPTEVIHSGTEVRDIERDPASFDPELHGIDFFETLEGMLVQVDDAQAVGPTDGGEIVVVGDRGEHATGMTDRGGIIISPDDFNPERIHLSDWLSGVSMPNVNVGDYVDGSVVGVVDYADSNYKVRLTASPVFESGGLEPAFGTAVASDTELSISSFNIENLGPDSPHFERIGNKIVDHLRAPDLLNVIEIMDNDGTVNSGNVDASETYAALIGAIEDAGGPTYDYRQIDPENNQDGGVPGGNIRVGFLFRTDRGLDFVDRPGGDATTPVEVVAGDDGPELSISPGRIEPQNAAWSNSRKPLVGEFTFQGEQLFVVGTHFLAKIADEPLFGRFQLPNRSTEVRRADQARLVNGFVQDVLEKDEDANVVVLGDMNDFHFSNTNEVLEEGGALTNLLYTLPENERYTYVFQGNSQDLDQFLVSPTLFERLQSFEIVWVASEFWDQFTDHEPTLGIFDFAGEPENQPPTVEDLDLRTRVGTSVDGQVIADDPDGDPLTFTFSAPVNGTLTPGTDGAFTYTPNDRFRGIEVITVTVDDGRGGTAEGTITITVRNGQGGGPGSGGPPGGGGPPGQVR